MIELAWILGLLVLMVIAGVGAREVLGRAATSRAEVQRGQVEPEIGALDEATGVAYDEADRDDSMGSLAVDDIAIDGVASNGLATMALDAARVETLDEYADFPLPDDYAYREVGHAKVDCGSTGGAPQHRTMGDPPLGDHYSSGSAVDEQAPGAPPVTARPPGDDEPDPAAMVSEQPSGREPEPVVPPRGLRTGGGQEDRALRSAVATKEVSDEVGLDAHELIISLLVLQPTGENFAGADVERALAGADFKFGAMRIFHHFGLAETHNVRPVLSVAKALEPGHFIEHDLTTYQTPGLVLFMRLPGLQDGSVMLELLLSIGEALTRRLGGVLTNGRREPLTGTHVAQLRAQVRGFVSSSG